MRQLPPLLADLHVHLLGTGDTAFWQAQLQAMEPGTVLFSGDDGAPATTVAALQGDPEAIRSRLVLAPAADAVDFSRFARCFHLRQADAGQRPDALANLIAWNASRYRAEGVCHVEFSIGVGWVEGEHAAALRRGIDEAWRRHGVHVGLLLGFDRTLTSPDIRGQARMDALFHGLDEKLAALHEPAHFELHLAALARLRAEVQTHGLASAVLGLDLTGDERFAPYAPFLLPPFREFVEEQQRSNHRFGIRLHAGELAIPDGASGYVALRVTEAMLERCWRSNIPARVGHGIGVTLLDAELGKRFTGLYGAELATRARQACRETLRTATTEVCLTSNWRLVGHAAQGNPVRALLADPNFHCVLGTDDPHIFDEAGSLSAEFRRAAEAGLLRDDDQVERLRIESIEGSFAPPDVIATLAVGARCLLREQDPPPEALAAVSRVLDLQRPEAALRRIQQMQVFYRRSQALWELRERAEQLEDDQADQKWWV